VDKSNPKCSKKYFSKKNYLGGYLLYPFGINTKLPQTKKLKK